MLPCTQEILDTRKYWRIIIKEEEVDEERGRSWPTLIEQVGAGM